MRKALAIGMLFIAGGAVAAEPSQAAVLPFVFRPLTKDETRMAELFGSVEHAQTCSHYFANEVLVCSMAALVSDDAAAECHADSQRIFDSLPNSTQDTCRTYIEEKLLNKCNP